MIEDKVRMLLVEYYKRMAGLMDEQEVALKSLSLADRNESMSPYLVMHLRDSVTKFYRSQFEQINRSIELLEEVLKD